MIDTDAPINHGAGAGTDDDDLERRLRAAIAAGAGPRAGARAGGEAGAGADTPDPAAEQATRRLLRRVGDEGLADISYSPVDSPFGQLLLACSRRGLLRLAFPEEDVDGVLERLARRVSPRIVEAPAPLEPARRELEEYFAGARREFDLKLDWSLIGPFGRRVLRVTSAIPFGGVRTYGAVAADAGSPRGFRAAGNALGSNPIPIVIPCHRVLRSGGDLGGYGGGVGRKRYLLELEGAL
jgi:methylated-DNA-[protein]-cysteine S-methyltransferase